MASPYSYLLGAIETRITNHFCFLLEWQDEFSSSKVVAEVVVGLTVSKAFIFSGLQGLSLNDNYVSRVAMGQCIEDAYDIPTEVAGFLSQYSIISFKSYMYQFSYLKECFQSNIIPCLDLVKWRYEIEELCIHIGALFLEDGAFTKIV